MELTLWESLSLRAGTDTSNRAAPVYRWYPYLEAFSQELVQVLLSQIDGCRSSFYDPFSGSGTSVRVAGALGMRASYSEINPFLRLVTAAKTLRQLTPAHIQRIRRILRALAEPVRSTPDVTTAAHNWLISCFDNDRYFTAPALTELYVLRRRVDSIAPEDDVAHLLARVALGAIVLPCSNLIRAGDVRYRKGREWDDVQSPNCAFRDKIHDILDDLDVTGLRGYCECAEYSALTTPCGENLVDVIVTSPPYLNGTNYFRNTKLELWVNGLIQNRRDLQELRGASVTAGIIDVAASQRPDVEVPHVAAIIEELSAVAYDGRIPRLVAKYFSDATRWLANCHFRLKPGGLLAMDIGDSSFAGVHIPTDGILAVIAERAGFDVRTHRILRPRRSRDGTRLHQAMLILKKKETRRILRAIDNYRLDAQRFHSDLPYRAADYKKRNWGDARHSLCSYQGKLKPALAHFLVSQFTRPGDIVLDPMSGSGTIPLEVHLQGRTAWAIDIQPLGATLSRAKVGSGTIADVKGVVAELKRYLVDHREDGDSLVSAYRGFGFNGSLGEYFERRTFAEIVLARQFFKRRADNLTWANSIVKSVVAHLLHGNRPYALSRNSHPVTPFAPTGPYQRRELMPRLEKKLSAMLLKTRSGETPGQAWCADFLSFELPQRSVDSIITSPPFAQSTRFWSSNWMRIWFCGWEPDDFSKQNVHSVEHRQRLSFDVYTQFFNNCADVLKPGGKLILHTGHTKGRSMAKQLIGKLPSSFEMVYSFNENVQFAENFGVRDQGATTAHEFIFARRR